MTIRDRIEKIAETALEGKSDGFEYKGAQIQAEPRHTGVRLRVAYGRQAGSYPDTLTEEDAALASTIDEVTEKLFNTSKPLERVPRNAIYTAAYDPN